MDDAFFQARVKCVHAFTQGICTVRDSDDRARCTIQFLQPRLWDTFVRRWTDLEYDKLFVGTAVTITPTQSTVTVHRGECLNCHRSWTEHHNGKCLFGSSTYRDNDGDVPVLANITTATPRPRPTFSACLRAVRTAAGDKRRYTEAPGIDEYVVQFQPEDRRRYSAAVAALIRLNPAYGTQYLADDARLRITLIRQPCKHCGAAFSDHSKPNNKCLFSSTVYVERVHE